MATRPQQHGLLLLAGLLVCLQQTGAMPMHPDLLTFIKLPAASDPSEQLQQAATRKLQQTPLFEEGGGEVLQPPDFASSRQQTQQHHTDWCFLPRD